MDLQKQDEFLLKIQNKDIESRYGVPPHGFCLGCMLKCHENHEVNELYARLDFRCDCGNSKMPESCQLNDEKAYLNEGNKYGQNFFDGYCYCGLPHDQEAIEAEKVTGNLYYDTF